MNMRTVGMSVIIAGSLAGCAAGPKIAESGAITTTVPKGKSQVIVYRDGILGAAIQPAVTLDGQEVGRCIPNGAFNVFTGPGKHELNATTEVTRGLMITTAAGRTTYVKCSISFGVLVGRPNFEEVSPSVGAGEIQGLTFTGQK